MSARRILIVEDNIELRKLIRLSLDGDGHELHEVATGDECLQTVHAIRPHLVILDVMMPGSVNGLEVCAALRRDAELGEVRILMLSARGQARDIERGTAAGADAYVVKPFSPTELATTVQKLLGQ